MRTHQLLDHGLIVVQRNEGMICLFVQKIFSVSNAITLRVRARRLVVITTYVHSSIRHAVHLGCSLIAPLFLCVCPRTVCPVPRAVTILSQFQPPAQELSVFYLSSFARVQHQKDWRLIGDKSKMLPIKRDDLLPTASMIEKAFFSTAE